MGERRKQALEKFHRDSIMDAAGELFGKKGIDGTTMDDIAKLADYSKSTIYVYFKSKEEIYNSILIKYADMLAREISDATSGAGSFSESFISVCDSVYSFKCRFPDYFDGISKGVRDMTVIDEEILSLIARGKAEKVIAEDVDAGQLALFLWSGICGMVNGVSCQDDDFKKRYGITKEKYLKGAYKRFYISLIRG